MNYIHPNQILKTLEIYDYYDKPISRLVLYSSGQLALIESISMEKNSKELVVFLTQDNVKYLKNNKPKMKDFFYKIAATNKLYLYIHNKNDVLIIKVENEQLKNIIENNFTDEYFFEDNSRLYFQYC